MPLPLVAEQLIMLISESELAMDTYWIAVTGVFASGKTTFIRTISETEVVSPEIKLPKWSISFDVGQFTVDQNTWLQFYGNPSNYSGRGVFEIDKPGLLGVVVLIDSAKPETFREARSILETFRAYQMCPYVVAVNKQDKPNAWSCEDLRIAMRNAAYVDEPPFIPCVATNKESVKNVLITLLEHILWLLEDSSSH